LDKFSTKYTTGKHKTLKNFLAPGEERAKLMKETIQKNYEVDLYIAFVCPPYNHSIKDNAVSRFQNKEHSHNWNKNHKNHRGSEILLIENPPCAFFDNYGKTDVFDLF